VFFFWYCTDRHTRCTEKTQKTEREIKEKKKKSSRKKRKKCGNKKKKKRGRFLLFLCSIAALQDRSSLGLHPGMLEVIDKSILGL
jgi:hypothetical protein